MVSRRDFLFSGVRRVRQNLDDCVSLGSDTLSQAAKDEGDGLGQADRFFTEGRYEQARDAYQEILDRDSEHPEAKRRLMICSYRLEAVNHVKVCARQILRRHPENHEARLYLGLAWLHKGKAEKAMAVWKDYFDLEHPLVLRAVNVHRALFEEGEQLDCRAVVQAIEQAMEAAV